VGRALQFRSRCSAFSFGLVFFYAEYITASSAPPKKEKRQHYNGGRKTATKELLLYFCRALSLFSI
jgi:hypothetical protein